MSAQRLSPRSVRRIERATGLSIVRAWSHGGYWFDFVIADPTHPDRHRHGAWHKKDGAVEWDSTPEHYNTCAEMFPRQLEGEDVSEKRYVVLVFDDGDRLDYEPPLPHPAEVFLERFARDEGVGGLSREVGATAAFEVVEHPAPEYEIVYPPSGPPSRGWLDGIEKRRR